MQTQPMLLVLPLVVTKAMTELESEVLQCYGTKLL